MLPQRILAILLHLIPVLCLDDPFLDESEANNFLRRSRRNNRGNIFEEIWAGNQERECIEESCGYEEAREVFEDRGKTNDFWQKYLRCKRAPSFSRNKNSNRERAREALRNCISDTDQCTPFPCVRSNTVKCVDAINNYKCECKPGYTGRRCESPVNECASNPCHGSARCEDEIGGFRCVCDSLHEGILCENVINDCRNVASKRCSSAHGRCLSAGGGAPFRCVCNAGYTGTRCEEDIDECADSSSCDQTCTNTVGSFVCSCGVGFILDTRTTTTCKDIDECADDLHGCEHFCHNSGGGFKCSCEPGFQLDDRFKRYCEDINECSVNNGRCPVIEGGCGFNRGPCETCHNTDGAFTCYCPPGFTPYATGQNCEDIDECQDNDHDCQHECENFPGGYHCLCNEGYKLNFNKKTCSDVNECLGDHGCENRCVNSAGSYTCTCNRGFKLGEDGRSCVDNDECAGGDTRCDQQCVNTNGSYECACRTGYRLMGRYRCSALKKHCASSPCGRNGRCHDVVNSFTCECRHGFSGERCEIDENPCLSNPCLNGGTCERNEEGFSCRCTDDYDGDTCQIEVITCADGYALQDEQCVDVDECLEEGLCQHECENTEGSFSCLCNEGFSVNGNQCDDIDECVDGPCEQMCTNIPGSYSCSCSDGYVSRGDGGGCEKTYTCFDQTPRMLSEPHLLLGTKKNDFLAFEIDDLENIFIFEFEYRTLDPDALLLAMSDRTSQRYIFVSLENGLLSVAANLDDSHTERSETPSSGAKLDEQWHTVLIKKRNNRIRVSKDGKKLRDLRFSRDDFGSVNMLYYGGLPLDSSVDTDSNLQQYGDKRFQGCLRKMSRSGMRVTLANDPSPEEHIGCFEKIGSGMFFNGTGEISVAIPEESTLRMRFSFKSRVPRGSIALVESRGGDEFSLKIDGNQLTAEMTTDAGLRYSSVYTAEHVEALCNDLWHVCDVTVSPTRIRLHVDGLEAQEQNFDGMSGIRFGENAILHLGGRADPASNYFAGSLQSFVLNNRLLDLSDPLEMSGVFAYTIPLP